MQEILGQFHDYLKVKDYDNTYLVRVRKYLTFCSDNNMDYINITYDNLNKFFVYLKEKNYMNSYINNITKGVRCFYIFLVEADKCSNETLNTVKKFKLLKEDRKIKDFITKKELDMLVSLAISSIKIPGPHKLKTILYFLFFTGLRKGEMINLKRADIDLKEGRAIVRTPTKNKEERYAFFPKHVSDLVKTYFDMEPEKTNAFNLSYPKLYYLIRTQYRNFILK